VSGVELRELQYFVVVSEELNFARSAERLHIAPSAVSERIKRLEDELGVRLFDRTSRRVRLTRDGRQLLAGARRVMSAANELTALAGSLRTERVGTLVLAFAPNLGAHAGVLLSRLAADHPEVGVVARSMWSDEALASVSRGDASAALARVPVTDPLLESELIAVYYDDHVAVSDDHPLAGAEHISVRAFDGLPVLVPEHDAAPHVHDLTAALFERHDVTPRWQRHRLQSYEALLPLVSAGMGSALVHSHMADLRFPGVAVKPLTEDGPRYELRLAWRQGDGSPGVIAARESIGALAASPM
jgi:DNA-binding transcriptional LysR family regulator